MDRGPGNLRGALNDILQAPEDRPAMPSPVAPPAMARPASAGASRGGVPVRWAMLIAIVFAVIVFVAIRPILPIGSKGAAAKIASLQAADDEAEPEYRDPLFQPFVD